MSEVEDPNKHLEALVDNEECTEDELVTLREAIAGIAGEDGWWKSYSRICFERAAVMLCDKGLEPQDVYWHLSGMYSAVANCYGG